MLLEELQAAVWQATDADRPRLYGLLAEAYGGASGIAHQLGYLDLRAMVLDRIECASCPSGARSTDGTGRSTIQATPR